ncbi:NCA2-domain-containing protein [Dichomitus squalens LYAD-421 SS1]|uniref:NCA2-domain-containing protein n=1 Tax=Dichomitus squalens (strain LYAD-421) TaxID=732165 RepID=R7SYC1_DICSQ|nr:NCA2-domain-containing protein [Dichomitus squalens LYAD-421 SS1]EJF61091.1 NCA2-domain-containing protein [Dichomitus squalens LYAD-421 SS1]
MSTFVSHVVADLAQKALPTSAASASTERVQIASSQSKEVLRTVFVKLEQSQSPQDIRECIDTLQNLEYHQQLLSAELVDGEEQSLRRAILGRLALGLYGQALTTFLDEASEAEAERQWWSDIVRSRRRAATYLLQTLPLRIVDVSNVVLSTLRTRNIPIHLSVLKPSSLRQLFPPTSTLRPNTLTLALFPHLHHEPYSISLTGAFHPLSAISISSSPTRTATSAYSACTQTLYGVARVCGTLATLPLELARSECSFKRKELTRIRDERAEVLGYLVGLRDRISDALETVDGDAALFELAQFVHYLQAVVSGQESAPYSDDVSPGRVLESLSLLANLTLPSHASLHSAEIKTGKLRRPSWLTLTWPQLVLLPPLALYGIRTAYASRATLEELARDALETMKGFWEDWILEPLRGIVRTVRAGRDDGVIVTKESVRADLDSLERMTLALAQDKLHYSSPQLEALSRQVQMGDLTAVMQIYEEDIKSPLRSAVQGTLLRSLFVQVQKAKVDIDMALSGIDKLLKSQELTFAFVGVAPALAIVYAAGSYLQRLWSGGKGRGRYGGKAKRMGVWAAVRRVDRLLTAQPKPHSSHTRPHRVAALQKSPATAVSPLTSGLLLLSVTQLRKYAETTLPANSRLREGFLEDVTDLEDPGLGRADKLRVVDRMWRSWGEPLGWNRVAD